MAAIAEKVEQGYFDRTFRATKQLISPGSRGSALPPFWHFIEEFFEPIRQTHPVVSLNIRAVPK